MHSPMRPAQLLLGVALLAAVPAAADLFVWVDEAGQTHVTDDPAEIPDGARSREGGQADLHELWGGRFEGPPPPVGSVDEGSGQDARIGRLLRGAAEDLRRGETARAAAALEGVLRLEPGRPEAHWYLALLDRQRGRFESAADHLEAFLAHAGDAFDPWRDSARRRLRALADEQRLAAEAAAAGPLRLASAASPHFRIRYDEQLGNASPDYAATVARYLEEAYVYVTAQLGFGPQEPTGVVLYGKAAYLAAHQHRFSFPTVGFFDGEIHVASAAHPAGELRSLLFHEYTHALFAERSGGHRPFWLNEGFAELFERASLRQDALSREERARLRRLIDAGGWIPLRSLAPGFSGLVDGSARIAYLESTAVADWIRRRSDPAGRRALLDRIAAGQDFDRALRALVGVDTEGLEHEVEREILAEFPATPARVD
jgi:hypothetical protein